MKTFIAILLTIWEIGLTGVMQTVAHLIPITGDMQSYETFVDYEYPGMETFNDSPGEGWSLGYDKRSIAPADWEDTTYFLAGYLFQNWPGDTIEEVLDDMLVRTVVLGDGRNKIAYCVIDAIGVVGTDVQLIREGLAEFAAANGIVSINVAATHSHSGVDTIGIWTDLPKNMLRNIAGNLAPWLVKPGKAANEDWLAFMRAQITDSIKAAAQAMEPGILYQGQADISEHITDNREPDLYWPLLTRLHFVPAGGGRPTMMVHFAGHPAIAGLKTDMSTGKLLTGDFPYYLCETLEKAGNNAMFIQGDIAGIYPSRGASNEAYVEENGEMEHRWEQSVAYGRAVGAIALGITEETALAPVVNVAHRRFALRVTQPLVIALGRSGLMRHTMLRDRWGRLYSVTEVGYLELGSFKAALFPGEALPELVTGGGAMTAEGSFKGRDFGLPSMSEIVGDEGLVLFGLCNDMTGYVIPDNDYSMNFLQSERQNSNQELINFGRNSGSTMIAEFQALIEEVRGE